MNIVDDIIASLTASKPKTMVAVNEMISSLRKKEFFYGLLFGEIQAGKTPAQMILIWIWTRSPEFMGNVCFVTKSLDSIRKDIMSKFNSNLINHHIVKVCANYGISEKEAIAKYGLTYNIYRGDKKITIQAGKVEILLMQKDNLSYMRRWYNQSTGPILIVIDEVHEMYSGGKNIIKKAGISEDAQANIGMLHWLHSKSTEKRCHLVGVTATPYAPMTGDPICWPTKIFHLETDAPAPGLEYYGYKKYKLTPNINIDTFDTELSAVDTILNSPRNVLDNGETEIPFICITTHRINEKQNNLVRELQEKYQGRLNILEFNQTNGKSLKSWFKEAILTDEICASGALVIVGQACLAAGITVKPSTPLQRTYNGVTYTVSGITDQFMPDRNINITSTKQLMRLLGWFPAGHSSTLWVSNDDHYDVYSAEIGAITRQFLNKYDIKVGPESVAHISLEFGEVGIVKHLYSSDFYSSSKKSTSVHVTNSHSHVENKNHAKTIRHKLSTSQLKSIRENNYSDVTIGYFFAGGHDSEKITHQSTLKNIIGFVPGSYMHIGYTEERTDQIMRAALKPHVDGWKVNGFLWGNNGVDTKISECYIVTFEDSWTKRMGMDDVYFERAQGEYVTLIKTDACLLHKSIQEFLTISDGGLSKAHFDAIKQMDAETKKIPHKLNAWDLFRTCHKIEQGTGSGITCSPLYKKHKIVFNNIVASYPTDADKVTEGCKIIRTEKTPFKKLTIKPTFQKHK